MSPGTARCFFFLFATSPDLEQHIFVKAFQLMENARKKEEEFAVGGWQTCCMLHRARTLQKAAGVGESPEAVDALLEGVEFARSSDFQVAKKSTAEALKVYDRVTAGNLQDILARARVRFPKSVLDMTSKLVCISQKACSPAHSFFRVLLESPPPVSDACGF